LCFSDAIDVVLLTNRNVTPSIDVLPLPRLPSAVVTSALDNTFSTSEEEETETEDNEDPRVTSPPTEVTPDDIRSRRPGLVYTESRPSTLRCLAIGISPSPPSLRLHIGRRDVTDDFRSSVRSLIVDGQVGLRLIRYVVELWRHDFLADVADRSKRISCMAYSANGISNTTSKRLILNRES